MKHLAGIAIFATIAAALVAVPLDAQPRGGSRGGGYSRGGGGGSRPSSSMSSSRGGGMSRGSSSISGGSSRTYSAPSRSYSAPSRSYSGGSTKGLSSMPRSGYSNPGTVRPSTGTPATRSGNAVTSRRTTGSAPATRSSGGSVATGRPVNGNTATRSGGTISTGRPVNGNTAPRSGNAQNNNVRRPSASGNGASPARSDNPATRGGQPATRSSAGQPRNFAGGDAPRQVRMNPGPGRDVRREHPRHRDPMPFNRPSRFWDRGPHYFGYRVHFLPARYVVHYYWGRPYYIVDGLYYRFYNSCYYVCRPPFGVFFDPILDDIAFAVCNFAYYNSVYNTYRTINENADTITAQNEVIAQNNATIAQQNADIALNTERALAAQKAADEIGLVQSYGDIQEEYFYQDGVFFTKNAEGKYVTIVPPAGALVEELPDDYDTVTIDGQEYYKVDDTIFRTTVVDGSAYFEVLGQMTGDDADKFDLDK